MKKKKSLPPFELMEKMSHRERQKVLDEQLKWLVNYAYEKAPSTKERFDKASIVPSKVSGIKDLENLPLLRKDTLVDLYKANPPLGGLVTVPITELERVYVSPGRFMTRIIQARLSGRGMYTWSKPLDFARGTLWSIAGCITLCRPG